MTREPAYADKRRLEAEAKSASERVRGRMPRANVRRRGMSGTDLHETPRILLAFLGEPPLAGADPALRA